jgi:hypothetical protein
VPRGRPKAFALIDDVEIRWWILVVMCDLILKFFLNKVALNNTLGTH